MIDLTLIANDAVILGLDGVKVGMVDHVQGDKIGLRDAYPEDTRSQPRYIAGSTVSSIENGIVWLRVKAAEAVAFEESTTTYCEKVGRHQNSSNKDG